MYVELHCHSYYSFHDGASRIGELLTRAVELGYPALALTDHDNLCGAMEFARMARSLGVQPITGAEVTTSGRHHLTLLAETRAGYANLCQLLSAARLTTDRREPKLDPRLLEQHAEGLILLTGCPKGEIPSLVAEGKLGEARDLLGWYAEMFGRDGVYVELNQNLTHGDTDRNMRLAAIAKQVGVGMVATNNVHYHVPDRYQLHDCLVAIRHNTTLDGCHVQRKGNNHFHLKPPREMADLFREFPTAVANTLRVAERCTGFDLTKDLGYRFPDSPVPDGHTQLSYLRQLCEEAAARRYGRLSYEVVTRLNEELRLIERHDLAGFFLIYKDIVDLAWEVMVDLGRTSREIPVEENPPGRGRGSSVSMLVGYVLGLSHIDPLKYELSLERFLYDDALASVPDIDLDFPRDIREELIKRVHQKYGPDHAALTGMISTYKLKGAVRDLGKAFGIPTEDIDRVAKGADNGSTKTLRAQIAHLPQFNKMLTLPVWQHLIRLAAELDGFPKYLAQHPGGMIISSTPLTHIVPIQPGAIEARYVLQWDKNSVDDAGFVKIDFLALGALSQMQDAIDLVEQRTGHRPDLSRIDFEDGAVYDMICRADTIGIFQVESAAQMQTVIRIRPRNLVDMAHEVAAVRPGVGVNDGVTEYIARRNKKRPVTYDHPLAKRALERTLGVILFQDQVNQLAADVGGFTPLEADQLRRAFGRRDGEALLVAYWEKFRDGATQRGVDPEAGWRIFKKFNGQYMFPESHAFAFGVTAYQMAYLKHYYPLEFFVGLFNQQPMGFYNLETLKEDARRLGIRVLNPDANLSDAKCIIEDGSIRLGFERVKSVGGELARDIVDERDAHGPYISVADFINRMGLSERIMGNLVLAGTFDRFERNRRRTRWEVGLHQRPVGGQRVLPLPVGQDMVDLEDQTERERIEGEYGTLGLYPSGHVMTYLRPKLGPSVITSEELKGLKDGDRAMVAGLVIRRQRPAGSAVFLTLEDEYGHSPLIAWSAVWARLKEILKERLVIAAGTVSRRDGTLNVVINAAWAIEWPGDTPASKDWG